MIETAIEPLRVVWAVDLYSEPQFQRAAASFALVLARSAGASVEPVYVSSDPTAYPFEAPPELQEEMSREALARLADISPAAACPPISPPRVVLMPSYPPSIRERVKALALWTAGHGADLILTSTRGRRGLARLLSGSFAERLPLYSPVPTLVVNGRSDAYAPPLGSGYPLGLYPTDFSVASLAALPRALRLARALGSQLTFFHRMPESVSPLSREARLAAARALVLEARGAGVRADVAVIETSPSESRVPLADAIVARARSGGCSWIALVSRGSARSRLLGGVSRRVVRESGLPTWIAHLLPAEPARFEGGEHPGVEGRKAG
jgi:nucleotide-binding universal stress UspA family protein